MGYSPWSHKDLDMTEWLTHTHRVFHASALSFCLDLFLRDPQNESSHLNHPDLMIAALHPPICDYFYFSLPRCLLQLLSPF